MYQRSQTRSVLFPILLFIGINLLILSLARLGLGIWQVDRVTAVNGWLPLMLQGIRIDIASLCWLFGLPALFSVLFFHQNVVGQNLAGNSESVANGGQRVYSLYGSGNTKLY